MQKRNNSHTDFKKEFWRRLGEKWLPTNCNDPKRRYSIDGFKVVAKDRIEVNPQIHFGKPCIAGTRITVQSILELVREGISFREILRDYYPELQEEDIRACINYAIELVVSEDIHISTPA